MAEKSDVWKEPAIVWKTKKARLYNPVMSSVFTLFGATWRLKMTQTIDYGEDFQTIYLLRIGDRKPDTPFCVATSVQSTVIMKNDSIFRSQGRKTKFLEANKETTLWVCRINIASLQISGYADSEEVTVVCVFTDIPCAMSGVLNETGNKLSTEECELRASCVSCNLDSLSRDLSKLLENKVLPDINLKCGDRTVAAHKIVLAARSEVFSAMFQSSMLESETGVVDITDMDVQVFELFLKYVYTGRLLLLSDEALLSMYTAGDKYAISSLKQACSERMIKNLTQENCFSLFVLADVHSDQEFKNAILDFISKNMDILKSQEWTKFREEKLELTRDILEGILQKKGLS